MKRYDITNAETGLIHRTLEARSEHEALATFSRTDDERIVTSTGRARPYLTGWHGVCYIAEQVRS